MKLFLTRGWTGTKELISETPTEKEISELVNSLDWEQFHSVRLERDSGNWVDVSGNLGEDGLAIVYEQNGVQFVAAVAPESIAQLEKALGLFFKGRKPFRNVGSMQRDVPAKTRKQESDFKLWKTEFETRRKAVMRNQRRVIIAVLFIVCLLGSVSYLWFTDELRFVGRDTEYGVASVSEVKWIPIRGGYVQEVTYEFEVDGTVYRGYFTGTKLTGSHQIGDRIKIKFATNKPSISKRLARIKRK